MIVSQLILLSLVPQRTFMEHYYFYHHYIYYHLIVLIVTVILIIMIIVTKQILIRTNQYNILVRNIKLEYQ